VADRQSRFVVFIAALALCPSMARGQQETPQAGTQVPAPQPGPGQQATPTPTGTNPPGQGEEEKPPATPEMPPLSSGITIEPGSQGSSLSYVIPSFQWTGFVQEQRSQTAQQSGTILRSVYIGNIVLQRVGRRTQLNLDYSGGALFYSKSYFNRKNVAAPPWGVLQRESVAESLRLRRLQLYASDQFMYLPESPYGFPGFSGLTSFGGGSGGAFLGNQVQINQALLPTESVLTGSARRYNNVALGEMQYSPTARSTITATGTFSVLNFVDPGFINSRIFSLYAGYNYRLTTRDQVSVTYINYSFGFSTGNRGILNRGFMFGYGHHFSSRLSFMLSGGPSLIESAQPQGGTRTQSLWITNDSVQYRSRIVDLEGRFLQYLSPGSGVTHGAQTDWLRFTAGRRVFHKLHGSLDAGHAYNQAVVRQGGQGPAQFETWQVGTNLSREFREHTSVYVTYQFQRQIASSQVCFSNQCGRITERHMLGAGINWHGRPVRIR
jgi:hypothetical protein